MGQFKPGVPRHPNAGRKAGTPNKSKIPRLQETLSKKGVDPAEEILKLLNEKNDDGSHVLSPSKRMEGWLEVLSYCQAKPKAIEVEEDDFNPEEFGAIETAKLLELVNKGNP